MSRPSNLSIYLHKQLRQRAKAGDHNFLNLVSQVARDVGISTRFKPDTISERLASTQRNEYALFHMQEPMGPNSLTFRKVYLFPFWEIEKTNERWNWETAKIEFHADEIEKAEARRFYKYWRVKQFGQTRSSQGGYIYIPLQGMIQSRRSFQKISPVDMIKSVAKVDTRPIKVNLHPNEIYSSDDFNVLDALTREFPQVEISKRPYLELLAHCDVVVTQNSSVAFQGYFFEKPAILCAGVDFHHIAIKLKPNDLAQALETAKNHTPDYASYIYWFLQIRAINAGRDFVKSKIRTRLRHFGWDI